MAAGSLLSPWSSQDYLISPARAPWFSGRLPFSPALTPSLIHLLIASGHLPSPFYLPGCVPDAGPSPWRRGLLPRVALTGWWARPAGWGRLQLQGGVLTWKDVQGPWEPREGPMGLGKTVRIEANLPSATPLGSCEPLGKSWLSRFSNSESKSRTHGLPWWDLAWSVVAKKEKQKLFLHFRTRS